jgi:hypothetical protein
MDTHRLPPGCIVLEGPGPSWLGRFVRWRLGSPWGHSWQLLDAWTGIEAGWSGVRTFDPLERFAQLEAGRAFLVLDRPIPDVDREKIRSVALTGGFVGRGYHWVQAVWWALTRGFFVDRARHLVCSFVHTAIEAAALGRHAFADDAGETIGAERRRRGLVTPADYLSGGGYAVLVSAPGVGRWAVRNQPAENGFNPWADRAPVGSPRPPKEDLA